MFKRFIIITTILLAITNSTLGQTILFQDFEGAGDNWNYAINPATYDVSSDTWAIRTNLSSISPSSGSKFWGMRDLNNSNGGGNFEHTLTFSAVNIAGFTGVTITFDYHTIGYDAGDYVRYEIFEDGIGLGTVNLNGSTGVMTTISYNVPNTVNSVYIVLIAKQNGGSDYAGWDNVNISGTSSVPCVTPVNQPTALILSNITDASINGSFTGNGSNGYLVVRSTNNTLSATPVNGTAYAPGVAFGGGIVVSSSALTTFTASGLSATTTYYFFIFAYDDGCSGGPDYNTSNPLTNNDITLAAPPFGTKVVVSEYFNAGSPIDEWTELIVVVDNTDMRGWTIRDNNSSTSSFQPAITFKNIPFWNNMRGGTIIKIWHRKVNAMLDTNKDDGYVEFGANDAAFFSGGNFGSSPTFSGSSLNVASSGDFIELRDASATHIHALGHDASPGGSVGATANPKVLRRNNFSGSGESVRVVGNATGNYDGGVTTSNSIVTIGGGGITSGLANDASNQILWRRWREPDFTTQAVIGNICGATCVDFTWNKMTDPLPSDNTQGYIILRKPTAGTFTHPLDGTSYAISATLGGATVVTNLDNPVAGTTIMYTDNAATAGTAEYRIYGYRYTDDNVNGNSFDLARGRAYNITDFVTVTLAIPLPVALLNFDGEKQHNGTNLLEWITTTEINNDFFTLEKSTDAITFSEIGFVNGAGNSNIQISYNFIDDNPFNGINYYRLKQTDFDGAFEYFNTIALNNSKSNTNIYVANNTLQINLDNEISNGKIEIYDAVGRIVYSDNIATYKKISIVNFNTGIYIVKVTTPTNIIIEKVRF